MQYSLVLRFMTQAGEEGTLTISEIREDITKTEAFALMDVIIEQNIFTSKNGDYVGKVDASLVQRQVTKFELDEEA